MSKAGDVIVNPVTGERAVVRVGTDETNGELLISDLYIRPGGAVMGEHVHPNIEEKFTVLQGKLGVKLNGKKITPGIGETLIAPAGIPHDWWNAGAEETLVRVEVRPAARFEQMIQNVFGLAQDGKVNRKGMPSLLQLVMISREFADVVRFTRPPIIIQKLLFGMLVPLAKWRGYQGSYPAYLKRGPSERIDVESLKI